MNGELIELDAKESLTVDQALARASRFAPDEIIILCVSAEGSGDRTLRIFSSDNMTNAEAYWALSKARNTFF